MFIQPVNTCGAPALCRDPLGGETRGARPLDLNQQCKSEKKPWGAEGTEKASFDPFFEVGEKEKGPSLESKGPLVAALAAGPQMFSGFSSRVSSASCLCACRREGRGAPILCGGAPIWSFCHWGAVPPTLAFTWSFELSVFLHASR